MNAFEYCKIGFNRSWHVPEEWCDKHIEREPEGEYGGGLVWGQWEVYIGGNGPGWELRVSVEVCVFGFVKAILPDHWVPKPQYLVRLVHFPERLIIVNHQLNQHGLPPIDLLKHLASKTQTSLPGQRPLNQIKTLKVPLKTNLHNNWVKNAVQAHFKRQVLHLLEGE